MKSAPDITSIGYPLDGEPLNSSELRVADSYQNDGMFPQTELLMAQKVQKQENSDDNGRNGELCL